MTPAQERLMRKVILEGSAVVNGRGRRTVEALERMGLVEAKYDMHAQAKGNGIELVERITIRGKGQ